MRRTPNQGSASDAFKNAIETVKTNIRWTQKNLDSIFNWLQTATLPPKVTWRLPGDLYPYHYNINIKPYFRVTERPESYDGSVDIMFMCLSNTNKLVFHSAGLTLINSTMSLSSTSDSQFQQPSVLPWSYDPVNSQVTMELSGGQMFRAGFNYTFSVSFTGIPSGNNLGFYRTTYNVNGQDR